MRPVAPLLVLFLLLASSSPQRLDTTCQWRANVTAVEDLPHHEYKVLEDCLYYTLSADATKAQRSSNALAQLPPVRYPTDKVRVTFHQAVVRQLWMNEVWKEMNINGFIKLSWSDFRLRWSQRDWKLDNLKLKQYGHLWTPDVYSERHHTSSQSSDFTSYQNVSSNNRGNVTAQMEFRMQAQCDVDYSNYPNDEKHCCLRLQSYLYRHLISFVVLEGHGTIEDTRSNWQVSEMILSQPEMDDGGGEHVLVCLRVGRRSSTLQMALSLPMLLSAVVLLSAPFFGAFRDQLCAKLFALLLQYLCFRELVDKTPQVGFGDASPRIYKFYEFTLILTALSLLATLALSALARVERRLPPPHGAQLLAATFNARLCCDGAAAAAAAAADPTHKDYAADWRHLFVGANNAFAAFLTVAYVFGLILLWF